MSAVRLACFKVDVTPPLGAQLAYNLNTQVDTPIYVRGVILDDGRSRVVVVAGDFLYIWGHAWFGWRAAIARAVGTPEDRVFLHSVHQHDSLRIAPEWNDFMRKFGRVSVADDYCRETLAKLCRAAAAAVADGWQEVTRLKTASRRLCGLASNRRLLDAGGACFAMRFSMCSDANLRDLPVGTVDPNLRTIAFAGHDGGIIAALHFYATHPMAAYGRGMVSQDVPGVALGYAEREFGANTFNLYLTGCGGNVTFGKYHSGDKEESLDRLGRRLGQGIVDNLESLDEKPLGELRLAEVRVDYPLDPAITEEAMLERVEQGTDGKPDMRAIARLIICRNWERWRSCPLYRLSLGAETHMLSLPGEMCVEYQLYAQSLRPADFIACAAYGNGTYHYIPTAAMFAEGGYEPGASITTPEIQPRLEAAMGALLAAG